LALFQQDFSSELRYNADIGQDQASAPSRRQGVEISAEYRPRSWIELNTDLAFSKARYISNDLAAFGLAGPYIADAPTFIGSFGALVDNLGPWFGGLQWRILGHSPLNDGYQNPQDVGYSEVNVDLGYKVSEKLKVQANIFNLFNQKSDAAAYYYTSRLPGEPADGVAGMQTHPIEPLSGSVTVTAFF
jgi:outer membrane receptor protein involved in Fe transport